MLPTAHGAQAEVKGSKSSGGTGLALPAGGVTSQSHGSSEPNRKCCMTGIFPITSPSYSLSMPMLTLRHEGRPLISFSIGQHSPKGAPCLMDLMKVMALKYRY